MTSNRVWRLCFSVCFLVIGGCSSFHSLSKHSRSAGRKGDALADYCPIFCVGHHCGHLNSCSVPEERRAPRTWLERVEELVEYKEKHGNTFVPKRYPENPSLGNWVNKQRVMYRRYCANERPCSLTAEKVDILNQIGFCWDGTLGTKNNRARSQDAETKWWQQLKEFQRARESQEKFSASLDQWIRRQRTEYERFEAGDNMCRLDANKIASLNEIDPSWWKTNRQRQWDERCRELIAYRDKHGTCSVPINYKENKKLANWVSNCRKHYNLHRAGKRSSLSIERIEELDEIGMVWDRWEFEFEKKQGQPFGGASTSWVDQA